MCLCVCVWEFQWQLELSWKGIRVERRSSLDVLLKPTGVSYNGEIDISSPPLSAANVWPVLISVHQRARTCYMLTLACRQSLRAFPNQHHRRETNDETMKQWVVTIGEPKSMCEGEKHSKKKKKKGGTWKSNGDQGALSPCGTKQLFAGSVFSCDRLNVA